MRKIKITCCVIALLASAACIVLPVIGANGFFSEFRTAYSPEAHVRMLGGQIVGPIFSLAFFGFLLVAFIHKKVIPWWIATIGLIGSVYTPYAVGDCSHDFSHTVFSECSDFYLHVIGWLNSVSGLALLVICLILHNENCQHGSKILSRNIRVAAGILVYLSLVVGSMQGYVHVLALVTVPAFVALGVGARIRFWPHLADAIVVIVVGLFACFVILSGFEAATGFHPGMDEVFSDSVRLMGVYSLWFWGPFVIGVLLGRIRSLAMKPSL